MASHVQSISKQSMRDKSPSLAMVFSKDERRHTLGFAAEVGGRDGRQAPLFAELRLLRGRMFSCPARRWSTDLHMVHSDINAGTLHRTLPEGL